jgi:hypothetical protein
VELTGEGYLRYLDAMALESAEIEGLLGEKKTFIAPTSIQWIGVSLPDETEFEVRLDVTEFTPTLSATRPLMHDDTGLPYSYTTGEELARFHTIVVDRERFPIDPANPHAIKMCVTLAKWIPSPEDDG